MGNLCRATVGGWESRDLGGQGTDLFLKMHVLSQPKAFKPLIWERSKLTCISHNPWSSAVELITNVAAGLWTPWRPKLPPLENGAFFTHFLHRNDVTIVTKNYSANDWCKCFKLGGKNNSCPDWHGQNYPPIIRDFGESPIAWTILFVLFFSSDSYAACFYWAVSRKTMQIGGCVGHYENLRYTTFGGRGSRDFQAGVPNVSKTPIVITS